MKRYIKASNDEFVVDRQRFFVRKDSAGANLIRSIHPYDETEYHWAKQNGNGTWTVYRGGKLITKLDSDDMTWGEVAKELLRLDKEAKLRRTGGIW